MAPAHSWQKTLRAQRWKLLLGVLLAIAATVLGVRGWLGPRVIVQPVIRGSFVQTVVASGHVETAHRVSISSQITGTVLRIPVIEGQAVSAGSLLVELESSELQAASHQAALAVVQSEAGLRQLREVQGPVAEQQLRQAEVSTANAQATQTRNAELAAQGFISAAALDESVKALSLAVAQQRASARQFEATRARGSDTAVALASLAAARAGAAAAQARVGYSAIRAPVAGTLIARDVEAGDVVAPGRVLLSLSPQGHTQLIVAIDEKNLRLLALGQAALASADADPQQRFAATLSYINPGVNALTGAVEVKLDVPTAPAMLTQDMTVSVDIEVARHPAALLVPVNALHEAASPAPTWVLVVDGRHAVKREVVLGLRGGGLAEVISGLAEGDRVLPVAAGLAAGARLRAALAGSP